MAQMPSLGGRKLDVNIGWFGEIWCCVVLGNVWAKTLFNMEPPSKMRILEITGDFDSLSNHRLQGFSITSIFGEETLELQLFPRFWITFERFLSFARLGRQGFEFDPIYEDAPRGHYKHQTIRWSVYHTQTNSSVKKRKWTQIFLFHWQPQLKVIIAISLFSRVSATPEW